MKTRRTMMRSVRRTMAPMMVAASVLSFPLTAHAADTFSGIVDHSGVFGSVTGSYLLKNAVRDWQFIGFEAQDYSTAGAGAGFLGNVEIGYRWSAWDAAVGLTYARLGEGDASVSPWVPPLNEGRLEASLFAIDAELGYNVAFGDHKVRAAGGLRYARWDNTVNTFWPGAAIEVNGPVHHDFRGIGPVVKLDGSVPVGNGSGAIEYGLSGSVLFGNLNTYSNNPAYDCTNCSKRSTTAYTLGGEIGYAWNLSGSARAIVGWQAEYWSRVNVRVTDLDFFGTDSGTSGHLVTGPFLRVRF